MSGKCNGRSPEGGPKAAARRETWGWAWCTVGVVWTAGAVVLGLREGEWLQLPPALLCTAVAAAVALTARRRSAADDADGRDRRAE